MKTLAFKDGSDGYYECTVEDGQPAPEWTNALTPCKVIPRPTHPAPQAVTMRQARLALLQVGKLAAVNSAIAAIPGEAGDAARIEWEFSSVVERNRPYVQQIAVGLGLTGQQLDHLFTLAATL